MKISLFQLLATATGLASVAQATPIVSYREADLQYEGYAFAYFTGNDLEGEKIYFAASNGNNALDWQTLNDGQPVLASNQGTRGLRDPFIMRSPDGGKFFLIATDLSIGSGTSWGDAVKFGSRHLEVWESTDLVNWGEQRHVLVSPESAGNTWAPEAYYDPSIQSYIVFWASSLYNATDVDRTHPTYHRMMYAETKDFVTFGEPKIWQDSGKSRIDSTILKSDGKFYRFTKDEASASGCLDILQERSTELRAKLNGWTSVDSCIGRDAGAQAVEGPTAFRANAGDANGDKFYLFLDEFGGRGHIPLETADIDNPDWKLSASYKLPTNPRHGTVIPVTKAELDRLTSTLNSKRDAPALQKRSTLIPGLYADPNIAAFNCEYYIYATTDGKPDWAGNEFYVWKSSDLVSWTRSETPFLTLDGAAGNVPWATGNAWAPTIAERDGTYYFYFSGHNPTLDRKTIGVATASSPEGPFTAEPQPFILNNEAIKSGQAIDPQAFHDPQTDKWYLYWGNGNPVMAELNPDMKSLKLSTLQSISGLTDFREGSFVVYRAPFYHFTYSIDDTRSPDYRVGYATGPSATGPWTYHGVILEKDESKGILGSAHNSILNVPGTDEWFIAYHRFSIPNGNGTMRETTIDPLKFNAQTGLIEKVVPTVNGVQEPVLIQGCGQAYS